MSETKRPESLGQFTNRVKEPKKVIYVAAPVGTDPEERRKNCERALRWLSFLIHVFPDFAFCVPWLPYVTVLSEEHRDRGLRDDLSILKRCDGLIGVGGRWSPGMKWERELMQSLGKEIYDFTKLGDEPPSIVVG